jgi:hypothetical protein
MVKIQSSKGRELGEVKSIQRELGVGYIENGESAILEVRR